MRGVERLLLVVFLDPLVREGLLGGNAFFGVGLQHLEEEVARADGEAGEVGSEFGFFDGGDHILGFEGEAAEEEDVHDDAAGPDVGLF